ncbi:glycosyltransferase [Adlercreutzia sp. R21]|uniref:glycosyltransferase n=1 Tax=Adlercreutzia wanghongyangiae TaxID=3111451 RepID=UPI002DB995A2|nr:glycosyltransferase [Adlercreutzia sp. R21]MEC4185347.1 glycosyltransferase [Adlercreutzia sp. R21]
MNTRESHPHLEIVFPVRNEERRLEAGIVKTVDYLKSIGFQNYVLTIADNDSTDLTPQIAQKLVRQNNRISYLHIAQKGVGIAVRSAFEASTADIVGYMDIDLATDLRHLQEVLTLFECTEKLDFVNGSRWAKGYWSTGRPLNRVITSCGLTLVLKYSLGMRASDAICGFKFFRRECALQLMRLSNQSDNGWFFIIEMLIRAERGEYQIHELPVGWKDDGNSSVNSLATTKYYLRKIKELRSTL